MASTAGREIMNSEVAGSMPNVFPTKKNGKKGGYLMFSRACKTDPLNTTMRAMRSPQSHSNPEKSKVKLKLDSYTGNLIDRGFMT